MAVVRTECSRLVIPRHLIDRGGVARRAMNSQFVPITLAARWTQGAGAARHDPPKNLACAVLRGYKGRSRRGSIHVPSAEQDGTWIEATFVNASYW